MRTRGLYAGTAALLALSSCTAGATEAPASRTQTVVLSADSSAPAPVVPGAGPGGVVTVLINNGFEHLDPARTYVSRAQITNLLLQRTLTTFRHLGNGRIELVGDLATDTGRGTRGGREWTFTLRDGLAFEDGTPITSGDVAYAIARSFSPELSDGPNYLQQWLADDPDFAARYRGPYDGGNPAAPGVTTPDRRTIVLRFARPRPDIPFVVSLGNTTPVPRSRDTRTAYDRRPVATGPYRIHTYEPSKRLVLTRNPHWSAATDPVRTAHPDRFEILFGQTPAAATRRILDGADQAVVSLEQAPSEMLTEVAGNPALAEHASAGVTPYAIYLKINVQRVTDLAVRRALNCAFDRDGYIQTIGGRGVAEPATGILPKIIPGFHRYNAYECGPSGDPAKTRDLLGGRRIALRYGYRDNQQGAVITAFLRRSLGLAGFDLTPVPIPADRYYATVKTRGNGLDIYLSAWAADWPTGRSVIPPLADGRTITDTGNHNSSFFDDPRVNAEIDRIEALTDPAAAATAWGALDETIMRDHAPLVPIHYDRCISLNGSRVGGLHLNGIVGATSLVNAYVR